MKKRIARRALAPVFEAVRYLLIFALMLVILAPFLWMLSTSLGTIKDAYSLPPHWIPSRISLRHYASVVDAQNIFQYFLNSLKIAGLTTVGQLVFCSLAAYAFARLEFPLKRALFALLLASMMIPVQVTIVPLFILMKLWGLIDTQAALILPSLTSAFGVFFLRQFFLTIPRDLAESAKIDGAGNFTIYRRIFLPNATAALSALSVFSFLYFWNELLRPLIFLNTQAKKTLPLLILLLQGTYNQGNVGEIMAGATLGILPIVAVFLLAQRYVVEGIVMTGLKG